MVDGAFWCTPDTRYAPLATTAWIMPGRANYLPPGMGTFPFAFFNPPFFAFSVLESNQGIGEQFPYLGAYLYP